MRRMKMQKEKRGECPGSLIALGYARKGEIPRKPGFAVTGVESGSAACEGKKERGRRR